MVKSQQSNGRRRFAFIKGGDVVAELRGLTSRQAGVNEGNEAFLSAVMRVTRDQRLLVLSTTKRSSQVRAGTAEARTLAPWTPRWVPARLAKAIVVTRALAQLIRFRPDCIICAGLGGPLWATSVVSKLLSVPYVVSLHNALNRAADIDRLLKSKAVVCHGPFVRQQVIDAGYAPERVFEFDINLTGFLDKARAAGPGRFDLTDGGAHPGVILYIGRMVREKGIVDLFEACAGLLSQASGTRLVYVGEGSGMATVQQLAADRGLGTRVRFLGQVAHEHLPGLIAQSRVVVTPTRGEFPEGRCMAAIEPLELGVPVIAPDVEPFSGYIRDGENGRLFRQDSVAALRESICSVVTDDAIHRDLKEGACRIGAQLKSMPSYFEALQSALNTLSKPETRRPMSSRWT